MYANEIQHSALPMYTMSNLIEKAVCVRYLFCVLLPFFSLMILRPPWLLIAEAYTKHKPQTMHNIDKCPTCIEYNQWLNI